MLGIWAPAEQYECHCTVHLITGEIIPNVHELNAILLQPVVCVRVCVWGPSLL